MKRLKLKLLLTNKMTDCGCSYARKALNNTALYGIGKALSYKIENKKPKVENEVVMEKVGKSEYRKDLAMALGSYAVAQYGWWYLFMNYASSMESSMSGMNIGINVPEVIYKAGIIELISFMSKGELSAKSFLHELLIISGAEFIQNKV